MKMVASLTQSKRRGFGIAEIAVSAILLATALVLVSQIAITLATERKGTERRQRAFQEAANVMERLTSRPWDELTPEAAKGMTLTPLTLAALREGSLSVVLTPVSGDPSAKKITVEVGWSNRSGGREAPVRLVAWVYHREGSKP